LVGFNYAPAPFDHVRPEDDQLREAAVRGSETRRWNLANPKGTSDIVETANCYVVSAPGYYSLPLYYGNAYNNYRAFKGSSGTANNLVNHAGKPIDGSPIADVADATWVWQLHENQVSNIALGPDNTLCFDVTPEQIRQGNVVLAVRDASGTVLWSWHIWITPLDTMTTLGLTNRTVDALIPRQETQYFMKYNLGWVTPSTTVWMPHDECRVRVTQEGIPNPLSRTFRLVQQGHTRSNTGKGPYWQWGRKDPMPPHNWEHNQPPFAFWNTAEGFGWKPDSNETPGEVTLMAGIKNPDTFYQHWKLATDLNLWDTDNTEWGDGVYDNYDVTKSVYDPCPPGFKMPTANAWTSLIRQSWPINTQYHGFSDRFTVIYKYQNQEWKDFGNSPNPEVVRGIGREIYLTPDGAPGDPTITFHISSYLGDGSTYSYLGLMSTADLVCYWTAFPCLPAHYGEAYYIGLNSGNLHIPNSRFVSSGLSVRPMKNK
jgi:hypothetical protein